MPKQITVTSAEQSAARNILKRNASRGVATRSSVTKIANAELRPSAGRPANIVTETKTRAS